MKGTAREPTGPEKELQDTLDKLLAKNERSVYVVICREGNEDNPNVGTYRLFGNVGDEQGVVIHLLNFIDGLLEDDSFAYFASLVSKRALERIGFEIPGPKAN